jgi:uncharacterized protein YoxC
MSDAAVTTLVAGFVQVAVLVVGFLTLWIKLKFGVEGAQRSAEKAASKVQDVADKLATNTATTDEVNSKADTIVSQTNGVMGALKNAVDLLAARVSKLEDYNHTSAHRLLDAVNAVHLKVAELSAAKGLDPFKDAGDKQ